MGRWIDVAAGSDLESDGKLCVQAEGKPVVVCRASGEMHAFSDVCPHAGLPLGDGSLEGQVITCPFHGFAFDVASGRNVDFDDGNGLQMLGVRVTDAGRVEVQVGDPE